MKSILLTITFFILSSIAAAADLKADFVLVDDVTSLKEGDIVEATLKVWPLENADTSEFARLKSEILFNSFQLIQVSSVEPSANNADVVEVKGTYVIRASKFLTSFQLNYKGQIITVDAPHVKIIPMENKAEDYFVLDQSVSLSQHQFFIFLIILSLIAVIAFIKRERLKTILGRLRKDPRAQALRLFNEKFQRASTRLDYEEIYARKNDWLPLLKEQTSAYKEFFNVMNQHQYKPGWGSEELNEVKKAFEIIRGSFK